MRKLAAVVVTILLLVVTAASAATAEQPAAVPPTAAPGGPLTVVDADGERVTGRYGLGSDLVEFEGRILAPLVSTATVTVNGKRFTATRDLGSGTADWSGAGATLVPEDLRALTGLVKAVGDQWVLPARRGGQPLPAHQDLTARLAMLLAEAPAGLPLTDQVVNRPAERTSDVRAVPAMVPTIEACLDDVVNLTRAGSGERVAAAAACQRADDEGIFYFATCNTVGRTLCHDAGGHCFLCEAITSGPASADCMGECGSGCVGLNIYTYDCGDHDRCGRVHGGSTNPWDSECGDEYWDADDDFFLGWPNCW